MTGRIVAKLASLLFFAIVCSASTSFGQEWARKMFETTEHDFGTVARGSDTVYRFKITNCYEEDVHIQSVRSSCGCTSPSIENNLIKTWDKGYIVAKFNTRGNFTGNHSATLTVVIDKPFPAQVQLHVHGNIRGDVVFQPGAVNFEDVDQGTSKRQSVGVRYAGHSNWRIEDVVTASDSSSHYQVELVETKRVGGVVEYDLNVELKDSAPAGFLQDQLILVTSDKSNPRIPLKIEGRVVPEISLAPEAWVMGEVGYGQQFTKKFIVRGKKDFKIAKVDCDDQSFQFKFDAEKEAKVHVVEATFSPASEGSGNLKKEITVVTSLGDTFSASAVAYAKIVAPAESATVEGEESVPPQQETATAEVSR
jgi:hypothetical protein